MFILSQDKTQLINTEYMRQIKVIPVSTVIRGAQLVAVMTDDDFEVLGSFETANNAVEVLEFIQHCLTDENAKVRSTAIPTAKEAIEAAEVRTSNTSDKVLSQLLDDLARRAGDER